MTKRISITIAAIILLSIMVPQAVFGQSQGVAQGFSLPDFVVTAATGPATALIGALAGGNEASCGVSCYAEKIFSFISLTVGYTVARIAAFIITLLVSFIQTLIDLSGSLTSMPLVKLGFSLTLSLANLGFVLAIIVIAFITILRIQNYETKQLIKNLVVAALLVNFSFAMVGTIIDFTNVLSNYFLVNASPNGDTTKFGDKLAESVNIQKLSLLKINQADITNATKIGEGYFRTFASIAVVVIFNIFLVITFAAVAFMILVRHIVMIFLLILMPLAWLFMIFPGLSGHWSKWWSTFFKWTFFLPGITFFMFLSVKMFDATNQAVSKSASLFNINLDSASSFLVFDKSGILVLLQIIVQGGLLLGGLMAAQSMGITGADAMLKAAKGSANWITGKTYRLTGAPAIGRRLGAPAAGKIANLLSRPGLRWIPGAKTAAAGLATISSRKTEVEEYQKNYLADLTKDQFKQVALTSPVGPVAKAAILAEATKRKMVSDLTANMDDDQTAARLELFTKAANATNPKLISELLDVNPRFAAKFNKKIKEVVEGIRADKASDINKDSLLDKEVAMLLSEAQISSIFRNGSKEQKENLEKALTEATGLTTPARQQLKDDLEDDEKEIAALLKEIKETKETVVTQADKTRLASSKTALANRRQRIQNNIKQLNKEEKEAYEKLQVLKQRVGGTYIP